MYRALLALTLATTSLATSPGTNLHTLAAPSPSPAATPVDPADLVPTRPPGKRVVYGKPVRVTEPGPAWAAAPVKPAPHSFSDESWPGHPPLRAVVDGVCHGDASLRSRWVASMRTGYAKAESLLDATDMVAFRLEDGCTRPDFCRWAAGTAVVETHPLVKEQLYALAAGCGDPGLTGALAAPEVDWITVIQHYDAVHYAGKKAPWHPRLVDVLARAIEERGIDEAEDDTLSWTWIKHAAGAIGRIDDPAARATLLFAWENTPASRPEWRDAIALGFAGWKDDRQAQSRAFAACRREVFASECPDTVAPDDAEELASRLSMPDFDPIEWIGGDPSRRALFLKTAHACETWDTECVRALAAVDWARARAKAARNRKAWDREGSGIQDAPMTLALKRFRRPADARAHAVELGLLDAVPPGAGPRDVDVVRLLSLAGRRIDLDDAWYEDWSTAPHDLLLRAIVRAAGRDLEGVLVDQTAPPDLKAPIDVYTLHAWMDGYRYDQLIATEDRELVVENVVAFANDLLRARGSPLRAANLPDDGIVIAPEKALERAHAEGFLYLPSDDDGW